MNQKINHFLKIFSIFQNFTIHKCSEGKSGYFISVIKKQKNNNNNTINKKKIHKI